MQQSFVPTRLPALLTLVMVVPTATAIGAWQSISPSPTEVVEQRSAFVQSGGVVTDLDSSGVSDAAPALGHARAAGLPEMAATTF